MNYYAAEQLASNWCWAACIQMILSTRGLHVTQQDVVRRAFGDLVDVPADAETVAVSLNKWASQLNGQNGRFNATVGIGPPPGDLLVKSLSSGIPVIVGCSSPDSGVGHAIVITAVIYEETPSGLHIESIMVRDPDPAWSADQGKRKLTSEQFAHIEMYFLITNLGGPSKP